MKRIVRLLPHLQDENRKIKISRLGGWDELKKKLGLIDITETHAYLSDSRSAKNIIGTAYAYNQVSGMLVGRTWGCLTKWQW